MARVDDLFAELYEVLKAELAARGIHVRLKEGYRSIVGQADVVRRRGLYTTGGYAAAPGKSTHNYAMGGDVDISPKRWDVFGQVAEAVGFRWGGRFKKKPEPWHIDLGNFLSIDEMRELFDRAYLVEVS